MPITFDDLNLPVVIYAPHLTDGWRKTTLCRWQELEEAMRRMDESAARLIEEAAAFDEACQLLRPIMEANPSITVIEALAVLNYKARTP